MVWRSHAQKTMKITIHKCFTIGFILCISKFYTQTLTQTVRGVVLDKVSQMPLPGAVVQVLNTNPALAASADADGKFSLKGVAIGKQSLQINFIGYKPVTLQNLSVNTGKELVLTVNMEEDINEMNEVEIVAKVQKNKALNDMSTVSTRAFSVEETQKFAAAVNDPARMASSFAGVVQSSDGNNLISIRGNSPNGLLWRMEGVEIPNPNHFTNAGTSGGGISILSAQLLNNSDFSTGAFAAEYGNALSGVFDLKLRKGNNQKREYTFQLGLLGADIAAEGPFKKGYDGSYLINYRYSTLSMLSNLGVNLGDGITNFQDLSFNVFLPTKRFGNFGMFGFGGLSNQRIKATEDSTLWVNDNFKQYSSNFFSNSGALGLTHTKLFGRQDYLKTVISVSGNEIGAKEQKLQRDYTTFVPEFGQKYAQGRYTLSSVYTRKINARSSLRAGAVLSQIGYNVSVSDMGQDNEYKERFNESGQTQTAQSFMQLAYKFAPTWKVNAGLHYFQLLLNNSNSIEPRASISFEPNDRHTMSLGYGLHSQLQPIGVYFTKQYSDVSNYTMPNKSLGLNKAHHVVLSYDHVINDHTHIKTEAYYQHLFNIAISTDKNDTYSILNQYQGVATIPLSNKGLGRNYGLELTLERFLYRNFYYMISASVYESKYQAANGNWYNTRFNTNHALTITAGKEWNLNRHGKNRVLGFNVKSIYVGGFRYTPIDLDASVKAGTAVYIESQNFNAQNPDYYRLDTRISLKRNYKKVTSTVALDIQNTTNRKNAGWQNFNAKTGKIDYYYQAPLIPILSYRLEF